SKQGCRIQVGELLADPDNLSQHVCLNAAPMQNMHLTSQRQIKEYLLWAMRHTQNEGQHQSSAQLKDLGPEIKVSAGFSISNYGHLVSRQQALHRAVLQRFDAKSYAGGSYTNSQVPAFSLDVLMVVERWTHAVHHNRMCSQRLNMAGQRELYMHRAAATQRCTCHFAGCSLHVAAVSVALLVAAVASDMLMWPPHDAKVNDLRDEAPAVPAEACVDLSTRACAQGMLTSGSSLPAVALNDCSLLGVHIRGTVAYFTIAACNYRTVGIYRPFSELSALKRLYQSDVLRQGSMGNLQSRKYSSQNTLR
ncbi:hypothetical protein MMC29_001314, partial [Sticta canariensis]|nr:hypothetical protein [Sticta canariensis]